MLPWSIFLWRFVDQTKRLYRAFNAKTITAHDYLEQYTSLLEHTNDYMGHFYINAESSRHSAWDTLWSFPHHCIWKPKVQSMPNNDQVLHRVNTQIKARPLNCIFLLCNLIVASFYVLYEYKISNSQQHFTSLIATPSNQELQSCQS